MSREISLLINALASEKNVSIDIVYSAVEYAMASATKKKLGLDDANIEVKIDRENGEYVAYRKWLIVEDEEYTYPHLQKTIEEIQETDPKTTLNVGEYYTEKVEAVDLGRIGAQTAKQMIYQKIRDAEKEQLVNEFLQKKEKIVKGKVTRFERGNAIIELDRLEAILPRENMIPRELIRIKDNIQAYIQKIEKGPTKNSIILTRTSKEFLISLLERQVPEIEDGLIEIKAVAREPGIRSKVAVKSGDAAIDPQGTCIGVKGSRVNNISNILGGEKIDIILWAPDPAEFIINAISPAKVTRILIDEDTHKVDIVVDNDQFALAIGRNGQNIRLTAELTNWNLNVLTVEEAENIYKDNDEKLKKLFEEKLDVDEEIAEILVQDGFLSLEEIAYVPIEEMLEIEDFDEEIVNNLRARARDAILNEALANEEILSKINEDLKKLENVNHDILIDLAKANIKTRDELAELSVDELIEITPINREKAESIIMEARTHWFVNDNKENNNE